MGLLHRGEALSNEDFIEYIQKYSAACYRLTSIAKNPDRAIKPYMKEVHSRLHYSKVSQKCSGKNWIVVGDAYCFADPVYSTGSGVAMLEALTIANILNKNEGKFDHVWYEKNCKALLKTVIDGIGTWYSGSVLNKKINQKINRTILQGGFSRHFKSSRITEHAKQLQVDNSEAFLSAIRSFDQFASFNLKEANKVYWFDRSSFINRKNSLVVINEGKSVAITNKAVQKVFENHILGKKFSFPALYLIGELNLKTSRDKTYFWNVIRFIELIGLKNVCADRLYYFHPEKCEIVHGHLKLGDKHRHLIFKNSATIEFFEKLKGNVFFGNELSKLANNTFKSSTQAQEDIKVFLETFKDIDTFGQNIILREDSRQTV
jgi:hypothetical protein